MARSVPSVPFRRVALTMPPRWPTLPVQALAPLGFVNAQAFGAPTVTAQYTLSPTGWDDVTRRVVGDGSLADPYHPVGDAFGSPSVYVSINPSSFVNVNAFGSPTVTGAPGTQILRPLGVPSVNAFGRPTVAGNQMLYPVGWDDRTPRTILVPPSTFLEVGDKFGSPTVTLGSSPSSSPKSFVVSAAPVRFEPSPPGASRPPTLSSGFSNAAAMYVDAGTGQRRLLMSESFGYSVLSLASPLAPAALRYHDNRFPVGGDNSVPQGGDGQSDVQTIAVSPDGARAAFGMTGPAGLQTIVGSPDGAYGFVLKGDFPPYRPVQTLVHHVGGRYIAYSVNPSPMTAADVTTLPDVLSSDNLTSEVSTFGEGGDGHLAGNYIVYMSLTGLKVIDASSPGAPGSIMTGMSAVTIPYASYGGGRTTAYVTAAIDPLDSTRVWILATLNPLAGEKSPSYQVLSVKGSTVTASSVWRFPVAAGETWRAEGGVSSALIPTADNQLMALMWSNRSSPTTLFRLYSTTVVGWPNVGAPYDVPSTLYGTFSLSHRTVGFASGSSMYLYLPTTVAAYVISGTVV